MSLDFTTTASDVQVPASASLANLSTKSWWGWMFFRTYNSASGWRLWQKGYVGRDGFTHYCGGSATDISYQYNRTTSGVNVAALYSSFALWGANKWIFFAGTANGTTGTAKLFIGDQLNPPREPTAYSVSATGSGAYKDDSAIALELGNRGGAATNPDGLIYGVGWVPAELDVTELDQIRQAHAEAWRMLYHDKAVGLWRFGANGRGTVFDESGANNHGTATSVAATMDAPTFFGQ